MKALGKLPYMTTDPKTDANLPKPGDAVVVCHADGRTSFFLLDVDHKELLRKLGDGEVVSDDQMSHLLAAQKAMTLWFAGENEKIMEALSAAVNAPASLGDLDFPSIN